jgi:hypothetical protein
VDPERGPRHQALPYWSIQIGLSGEAVRRYMDGLLPVERPYPLPESIGETIGASPA